MKELQAGNVLNNRYEIVQKLGKGGFGEVYKARDTQEAERFVAIKRLLETGDDATRKRFEREHRFLSRVTHPNLVHAWEMFKQEKNLYMVMEFVPGNSLGQILKKGDRPFTLAEQLAIANKAARGLEVMNTAGILHRDIKPDNIMVDKASGTVKILDLGIGKDLLSASQTFSQGKVLGTLNYISPEQADDNVSETSDVFSLGVTLYQFFLWEKQSPFTGSNPYEIMSKIIEYKPESMYECAKKKMVAQRKTWTRQEEQAYRHISNLIEITMEKEPSNRCSSKAIADQCEQILNAMVKEEREQSKIKQTSLARMSNCLKPDFLNTLAEFHLDRREWEDEEEQKKNAGKKYRKRHLDAYNKKTDGFSTKRKALLAMLVLIFFGISIFWTITSQKPQKAREKAENMAGKRENKRHAQQETYGLPLEIWNKCKYQYKDHWILDMTTETWCALSVEDQQKYATAYQQGYAREKNLDVEKTITRSGAEFVMRLIPPGRFWMGSNDDDAKELQKLYREYDETRHRVIISKPYYIGKTEITQAQWKAVMKTAPSYFKGDNLPVEQVSWHDCQSFCKKNDMRLPTEAQWEYACRAGVTRSYFWGAKWYRQKLNNASSWAKQDLMNLEDWKKFDFQNKWQSLGAKTTPAETYRPNSFGLSDTLGNVAEWCQDAYGKEAYHEEDIIDPECQKDSLCVFRGGCWYDDARYCRCAFRGFISPVRAWCYVGLRVVIREF